MKNPERRKKDQGIKSRARVRERGEVFTEKREVDNILALTQATSNRYWRFLEPACGNGNFLEAILRQRLEHLRQDKIEWHPKNRSFKKKLREKLLKFVSRVPVFMYLTDYREEALIDVIRNLEPELFTKVTGLTIREFDQLCEVGAFNQTELNTAIAQFRRFEDASLTYAGGRAAHDGDEIIGLFDTKVTRDEADEIIEAEIG